MVAPNPLLENVARDATVAVQVTAEKSSNGMSPTAVTEAAPQIRAAVNKALIASPEIQNAFNLENHFWQKRTFWSYLASAGVVVIAIGNYMSQHFPTDGKATIGIVVGAAWAGYSAWRAGTASKPLGT